MDGAFDMMHYGHMNAFRLGRALGTHLIVGVNSDESISQCKGDPLMRDAERLTMVTGCKFVDEVVPGCPYVMNAEYLDYVIKKFRIDYVVHGDDPCIVDGKDVCEFFYFPPFSLEWMCVCPLLPLLTPIPSCPPTTTRRGGQAGGKVSVHTPYGGSFHHGHCG